MSLWRRVVLEAHRRSLWQVLGIYLFASWAGYQVILGLYDGLGLPTWVPPLAVVLFIIGLPIVLATAFVQEGAPGRMGSSADQAAAPAAAAAAAEPSPSPPRTALPLRLLTWRRSLLAGAAAFTLLAVAATGFMSIRHRNTLLAQGLIGQDDVILLADFASTGADTTLGSVVTAALRMDIMQSAFVKLAHPARVEATLARMQRSAGDGLPAEVAREVAVREGLKAVLAGEIGSLGASYVLSAELVGTDGSVLAAFRATARDSTQLIDAVDDLSRQIRDKIGEGLPAIRASAPLASVSTASLPALRKYAEAEAAAHIRGDPVMSVALFEEAVAMDSTFAMAWRKIGVYLNNLGIRQADRTHAITRAYELRDRLPELERYLATAVYEISILNDRDAAMATYRRALESYPEDVTSLNNLALALMAEDRHVEARPLLERTVTVDPNVALAWTNLISATFAVAGPDAARAVYERARQALPRNAGVERRAGLLAWAAHDWDAVDSLAAERTARFPDNVATTFNGMFDRMGVALLRGRLSDLNGLHQEFARLVASDDLGPQRLGMALNAAEVSLRVRADPARGLRELEAALALVPLETLLPGERPYGRLASLYADAGQFERAEALLEEGRRVLPPAPPTDADGVRFTNDEAYIGLRRGDPTLGLTAYRMATSRPSATECRICDLQYLGQAYELAGQADSARAVYDRFLTERHYNRLPLDPIWRPFVLLRAGELHEAAGDTARAVERYGEFVRLWEGADAELQPRVQSIRSRLLALQGRG